MVMTVLNEFGFNRLFDDMWTITAYDNKISLRSYGTNEDTYEVKFNVPGFDKDSLDVEIHDRLLTVSTKNETTKSKLEFYLSNKVDLDSAEAKVDKGILTVTFKQKSLKKVKLLG